MPLVSDIFICQRCGDCCHGETTVSLSEDDQKRMVFVLNMEKEEVRDRFWRVTGSTIQMKTVDGHCIFYKEGCKVHKGRPWRCAQWPLHPSILTDENNFHTIAESCPGIRKDLGYSAFCRVLRQLVDNKDVICV